MYFYAVTRSGWNQVRQSVLQWKGAKEGRRVLLFVGTDHGITDPAALEQISEDGVEVHIMLRYHGVFHPKVVWLKGTARHVVWVGSNNLTRDGLLNNIEFAMLVRAHKIPASLRRWAKSIEVASEALTQDLLGSYERQRREFEKLRAQPEVMTFTWERKAELDDQEVAPVASPDSLIVEVMPRETGSDGRQLQLPVRASTAFFSVSRVGSSRVISLQSQDDPTPRSLTITLYRNHTVRVVISDLEYRDRPCVIVFRKVTRRAFEYEIVPQSIFPRRYAALLELCTERTRSGSRCWGIV